MNQKAKLFVGERPSLLPLMFRFAELCVASKDGRAGRATEYWSNAGQNNDED